MTQDKFNWDLTKYIDSPYPDGESYKDVEQRIKNFLESIKEKHENEEIAIVAHQAPSTRNGSNNRWKTWETAKHRLEDLWEDHYIEREDKGNSIEWWIED